MITIIFIYNFHFKIVFEPDEDDKNDKEYKKIHEDYKNLVRHINKHTHRM